MATCWSSLLKQICLKFESGHLLTIVRFSSRVPVLLHKLDHIKIRACTLIKEQGVNGEVSIVTRASYVYRCANVFAWERGCVWLKQRTADGRRQYSFREDGIESSTAADHRRDSPLGDGKTSEEFREFGIASFGYTLP